MTAGFSQIFAGKRPQERSAVLRPVSAALRVSLFVDQTKPVAPPLDIFRSHSCESHVLSQAEPET
jgi:hypothetical protein